MKKTTVEFREKQLPLLEKLKPYRGGIGKHNTIEEYITNYFRKGSPATYTIDGRLQCPSGMRRSFYDLYYLSKAKFDKLEIDEFAFKFVNLLQSDKNILIPTYCTNIKKIVFHKIYYPYTYKSMLFKINKKHSKVKQDLIYSRRDDLVPPVDGLYASDIIKLYNKFVKRCNL